MSPRSPLPRVYVLTSSIGTCLDASSSGGDGSREECFGCIHLSFRNGTPVSHNVSGGETNETHEGDGNMEEDGESSEAVDMRSVFIGNVRLLVTSLQGIIGPRTVSTNG